MQWAQRWKLDSWLATAVAVSGLLVFLAGLAALREQRLTMASGNAAHHALRVQREVARLYQNITEADGRWRLWAAGGLPVALEAYRVAALEVLKGFDRLRRMTADNPAQQGRLARLGALLEAHLDHLAVGTPSRPAPEGGFDEIRAHLDAAVRVEQRLQRARLAARTVHAWNATALILAASGGALLLMVFSALVLAALLRRARAAESRTREEEERLRTTLDSIGDAVIATDATGAVVLQNPVAEALTGWPRDEARGKPLREVFRIVGADTGRELESPAVRASRDGAVELPTHAILLARDGREIPIDDSGAPIRDADGRLLGVVLVFRDASGRAAAERERWNLWRAEAARVEAERANEAKDAFLAILSHELRSPLSAMLAWMGILARRGDDAAMRQRAMAVLERGIRTLTQLINDLLDVSRIVSNKLEIERRPVELTAAVSAMLEELAPAAQAKEVALLRELCPAPLCVLGDESRLEQVVRNLVDNAIKFTPAGGRVGVALRRDAGHAKLVVSDTGEGFPPERRDLIFDRFQQAAEPHTRRHGGLGLGLAIVRHLVVEHGGVVSADSPGPGRGAVFTVRLPLTERDVVAAPGPSARESVDEKLTGVAVLLVEDDADWRDALALRLRQVGARVATAGDVGEAMARFVAQPPAVLVSDIGMPDADGYALIQAARGTPCPPFRAIAMTGFADPGSRARCLALGFDEFLAKPFEPDRLIETIASLLAGPGR